MSAFTPASDHVPFLGAETEAFVEDLVRHLLSKDNNRSGTAHHAGDVPHDEGVLVGVEVDGVGYALVRLASAPNSPSVSLSPREQEIVRLVANGLPNKAIADVLDVSMWTVSTHLRRIFVKLNVRSRAEMVAHVLGDGLLDR